MDRGSSQGFAPQMDSSDSELQLAGIEVGGWARMMAHAPIQMIRGPVRQSGTC